MGQTTGLDGCGKSHHHGDSTLGPSVPQHAAIKTELFGPNCMQSAQHKPLKVRLIPNTDAFFLWQSTRVGTAHSAILIDVNLSFLQRDIKTDVSEEKL